MTTETLTYGQQLERWMRARGLSVSTLAAMSGLTRQSIYYLLQGKRKARPDTHAAICRALGIQPDAFFAPMLNAIANNDVAGSESA